MANLLVDERDVKFVLYEQLDIERLCDSEMYAEFSREMFDMALDAAQKLSENELWPVNADGDHLGVKLENGQVRVPESYHKVYRHFCEGGWPSLSLQPQDGGQGFPGVMSVAIVELFVAANLAFMSYPGLTSGAARLLQKFGTQEQKLHYLQKMVTGEWTGTMCLTEPQAGSDVGALRTRAVRNADGTYSIVGNKIFISAGDHDLAENIVHLVLARVEGAPAGTKGISIFMVPKKRLDNGGLADNDVTAVAVEEKLGLHGSATCALNFGEKGNCVGYLIGEENAGMKIMFTMINEARLAVGIQGLALASGAYRHALRYAIERIQGPHVSAIRDPDAPKVPIIEHPDVRRMLLWMKSVTEGMRGLLYYLAFYGDQAHTAEDTKVAARFAGLVDLLIPVCKAWATDMGFKVTEMAVQVHGGYGYCREYQVEQFLRDIKITSIYEGANGIQALDLVGRKLAYKQGSLFRQFIQETEDVLQKGKGNDRLAGIADSFEAARARLIDATTYFGMQSFSGNIMIPVLYATPYLELFGDVAVGFILLWQAIIADERLQGIYAQAEADTPEKRKETIMNNRRAAFYDGKVASARFFANTVLSLAEGKAKAITSGESSALDIADESFGAV